MNRTMTSLVAIGLGVAAYQMARRNDRLNMRNVRKMSRQLMRSFT